ncbi:MAG: endolytic transglycosylase MltG [Caulobacteraceae bacterium]|nr:endolytic transglycosylase MltG [Caulobacteraceae bacterium]
MAASAASTLGLILAALVVAGLWLYLGPGPKAPVGASTTVILRQGAHLPEIAATLERGHAIISAPLFMAAAQITGSARRLKAGEYEFPSRASMAEVVGKIRRGEVVHHMVTIPEGLTSEQAVDILMNTPVLTGAAPIPPEGSILPETYEVRRGEDRSAVLQRMMDARDVLLRTLWAQRRDGLPFTSPEQAVTLASIVEKETALADERPRVAAVFLNRLAKGMRLGSDPTVVYGLTGGRPLGHGIRQSELATPTPYNTYLIDGLPPTPICNPGRASLAAVLDAPHTNELYFVANGLGGHNFASTLEAHQKNVEHWRAIEHQVRSPPPATGAGGG